MITRKAIYYGVLCLLAIIAVLWAVNTANTVLSYIPFTPQWNERRTAAKVPGLEADVSRLTREAAGNAEIGVATDTYHRETVIYRDLAHEAENAAENAPDGETPLSDERLARLHGYDVRVCDGAAFTCSTIDAANGRAGAVSSDGPAPERDAG